MTVIPYPSADVPLVVSKTLADDRLDDDDRAALRQLLQSDDEARMDAMMTLGGAGLIEEASAIDPDAIEAVMTRRRRLVPALVGLAGTREDTERYALLALAANLELGRLMDDGDVPTGLDNAWPEALANGRRLSAGVLAESLHDELDVRPLLMALAVFHGETEVAAQLLSGFGEEVDDDDFDDEDPEG